jgi:hypothetical protein
MIDLHNVSPSAARLIALAVIHLVDTVDRLGPPALDAVADDLASVVAPGSEPPRLEELTASLVGRIAAAGMAPPPREILDRLAMPVVELDQIPDEIRRAAGLLTRHRGSSLPGPGRDGH